MRKQSSQVAAGGVFSALCVLFMFMTGLVPLATYALPAMAGAMLIAVVVENGPKTAVMVYVSVSLMSLFIVPDREAAMMFIMFFGFYPILKEKLERLRPTWFEYIVKLALFNVMIVSAYLVIMYVFVMPDVFGEAGELGKYSALILLLAGNVVFFIYDFALTRYTTVYIKWFRPKFLGR